MAKTTLHKKIAAKQAAEALVITRIFDAPRELVWKALTTAAVMKKWWGSKSITVPVFRVDFRTGGKYLYCMRGPDGNNIWGTGVYKEIVPRDRLILTDSFADENGKVVPGTHYGMDKNFPKELLITVTLEDAGARTKMTLKHEGVPAGIMKEMIETSWSESFDKLAAAVTSDYRTKIVAERGKPEVIVTRTFDVPRDVLFKAYTDRNLIPSWWGPERFATVVDKMDVRPGGLWRYVQSDSTGQYAFHGVYHEVRSPELVVYTFEYEGAPGHVSLVAATFEEINGKTRLIEKTVFQSVEDRDAMMKEGMEEGVYESMGRLAVLLESAGMERKAA